MMMHHNKLEILCGHWHGMVASIVMDTGLFLAFWMRATLVSEEEERSSTSVADFEYLSDDSWYICHS